MSLSSRQIGNATLYLGDSAEVLKSIDLASIDACVTDPPYGLFFMGKAWDYDVPKAELWKLVYATLKPGAHLLSFFGSRTYHRGAVQIEDAGFDIRDQIMWIYGTGFPKSLDVSKAIDKAAGAEREVISTQKLTGKARVLKGGNFDGGYEGRALTESYDVTAPASDAARQWSGWGTALKPAHEPIVVARKPIRDTVAANVMQHGTGGLNIDACRVPVDRPRPKILPSLKPLENPTSLDLGGSFQAGVTNEGRWPANLIHDGSEEALAGFPITGGSKTVREAKPYQPSGKNDIYGKGMGGGDHGGFGDGGGSAARYFYCAKASKADREDGNLHPTVKPTDLMQYLCRLVTPPGGLVLDPFMGSGSTGKAALLEGFHFIGIERDPDYFEIACARIAAAQGLP